MKHLFIPYELAVIAKEKGFNEPCFGYWQGGENKEPTMMCNQGTIYASQYLGFKNTFENGNMRPMLVNAPLYQQIVDWFRENHDIHLVSIEDAGLYSFTIKFHNGKCFNEMPCKGGEYYKALNKAIEEAFKLI